jgi:flagellar biosynthesis/type III secretory pathway protein FliH
LSEFAAVETIDRQQLNVVADGTLEPGECRIEYATYHLASSLAQQVAEIEHRLLEVVNES